MAGKLKTISQSDIGAEQDDLPFIDDPLIAERTVFSPCRRYRYTLFRYWGGGYDTNAIAFLCMNPSGADASGNNDRTVAKCIRFSKRWGFDAMYMLNAFALRATDNKELYGVSDPVGPENDRWIREILARVKMVVCGWGKPGGDFSRGEQVEAILRECMSPEKVTCFSHNLDGTPTHPLYQKDSTVLIPFFRE
jgi:hypothetical protein